MAGLIEMLLVFGLVLGWAGWQWWQWWRWRRERARKSSADPDPCDADEPRSGGPRQGFNGRDGAS